MPVRQRPATYGDQSRRWRRERAVVKVKLLRPHARREHVRLANMTTDYRAPINPRSSTELTTRWPRFMPVADIIFYGINYLQ